VIGDVAASINFVKSDLSGLQGFLIDQEMRPLAGTTQGKGMGMFQQKQRIDDVTGGSGLT
jgi:hypothetical protein